MNLITISLAAEVSLGEMSVGRKALIPEMCGYVSTDRYFADIRNSHGYG